MHDKTGPGAACRGAMTEPSRAEPSRAELNRAGDEEDSVLLHKDRTAFICPQREEHTLRATDHQSLQAGCRKHKHHRQLQARRRKAGRAASLISTAAATASSTIGKSAIS